MSKSTFQKGSGCFNCGWCGRQTRIVKQSSALCPLCDELLMIENGINDGGYQAGAELEEAEALIAKLKAKAITLGGVFA